MAGDLVQCTLELEKQCEAGEAILYPFFCVQTAWQQCSKRCDIVDCVHPCSMLIPS
jgi:hypothetical protein